ncbi:MAG: tetratricopeptide repeat protein [Bacteroidales bacterium]|nr:tetratricopeptide repeat protein [Bacteroidales bacterium]
MKYIIIILLLLTPMKAISQPEQKYIRKGNNEYKEKKYNEAEINYRKALEKNINSSKAEYNLSNALYKQEKYEAAATKYFNLSQLKKNKDEISRYYYNLGNSLFKANKLNESIEAYKNALRNNPGDTDARHNLQFVLTMKNMQNQQQQQDNQGKKDQQDSQDKQDQKQQQQQQQQQQQKQQQQQNQQKDQISREVAERLLQALENDEKKVLQKVKEKQNQVRKVPVEKDW